MPGPKRTGNGKGQKASESQAEENRAEENRAEETGNSGKPGEV